VERERNPPEGDNKIYRFEFGGLRRDKSRLHPPYGFSAIATRLIGNRRPQVAATFQLRSVYLKNIGGWFSASRRILLNLLLKTNL